MDYSRRIFKLKIVSVQELLSQIQIDPLKEFCKLNVLIVEEFLS